MAVLTACHLCGQEAGAPVRAGGEVFCCPGCRELWLLLGEERLGELRAGGRLNWGALRQAPAEAGAASGEVRTAHLVLGGMWCSSCAVLVEHVLRRQAGVVRARADHAGGTAEVAFDPARTGVPQLEAAVARLGYAALGDDAPADAAGTAALISRLGVAAALALPVMMLSVPIWSGYLDRLGPGSRGILAGALWVLATPVVFWAGWPFLRGAWISLRHGRPTMDLLIATGSLSAYAYSVVAVLTGGSHLYFDTACMLVAVLLLGRALEYGTRQRATGVLRLLQGLAAREATRLGPGGEVRVPAEALRPGDVVVVRAGQVVPADGEVVGGRCAVDESALTGEAVPAEKREGDFAYAGCAALDGRLVIRAVRVGEDTVLGRTAAAVRAAQARGGRWQRLADRLLRAFVPGVLALAAAAFLGWRLLGGLGTGPALLRAIAVLVIACPCALGVATPLAALACAQRLGRRGVLLRSGDAVERAAGVDVVLLDKTGTVTSGQLRLVDLRPVDAEALALAAALEAGSGHPLAQAVVRAAEERGLPLPAVRDFQEIPGRGVTGVVDGRSARVGAAGSGAPLPAELAEAVGEWEADGRTTLRLEVDGQCRAVLALADWPRPEAAAAVRLLTAQGLELRLVTGDAAATAGAVARATGITAWSAQQSPADKAELVARLQAGGRRVAFVGDGINDAAALVRADLGIALAGGADVAVEAGELTLVRPDLTAVAEILALARQTRGVVRGNLIWALTYNALALPVALAGYAHPILAAAAMVFSSGFVLGNSLRLLGRAPWRLWGAAAGVVAFGLALAGLAWWGA